MSLDLFGMMGVVSGVITGVVEDVTALSAL
jgi:hypothetical protein